MNWIFPFSNEFFLGVQHLFSGNMKAAFIFFKNSPKEEINKYCKTLETSMNKMYSAVRSAWGLRCYALRFSDFSPGYSQLLFFSELFSYKDPLIDKLKPLFTGKFVCKNLSESDSIQVINNIFDFQQKFPEFFNILYNIFQPVLNEIGKEFVFKNLGNKAIVLFPSISTQDIKKLCIKLDSPHFIFSLPKNIEMIEYLQNQFTQAHLYPNSVPGMKNGLTLSLCNSAIFSKSTFIDVLFQESKEALTVGDFDRFLSLNEIIGIIYHIFIISLYDTLSSNPSLYYHLTDQTPPDVWGAKLYNRIKNELNFMEMISKLTNSFCTAKILRDHSFPFYLRSILQKVDITGFIEKRIIQINDHDFKKDIDFTLCFLCMYDFLYILTEISKEGPVTQGSNWNPVVTQTFTNIKKNLSLIHSKGMQNTLSIELFSLLFLEDREGYLCTAQLAELLIKVIQDYTDSPYVKQAMVSLITSIVGHRGNDISSYFAAGKETLIRSVAERKWGTAQKIIQQSPLYKDFYTLTYSVYNLVKFKELPPGTAQITPLLQIEFGLSSMEGGEAIRNAKSHYQQYSSVLERRISSLKNQTTMDSIENDYKYITITKLSKEFDDDYINFLSARKGEAFEDVFVLSQTLQPFIDYMSKFARCCFASGIKRELPMSLRTAFMTSINSGCIEDAKKLAENLGIDLFKFVMEHIEDYDINKEFVSAFINEHPLECTAIAVTMLNPNSFPSIPQKFKVKVPKIDDSLGSFIAILVDQNAPFCLLDDYLYRIDGRRIYNAILDRLDILSDEKILYCLDITWHFPLEKLDPRVRSIFLRRDISKITQRKAPKEIIEDIAKAGKVQLLVEYLKIGRHISKENIDIAVTNLNKDAKHFLEYFPEFSKYYLGIVPGLERNLSDHQKTILQAYRKLPFSIQSQSHIADMRSISDAIIKNEEYCHQLSLKDTLFLLDTDLHVILMKERPIHDFIIMAKRIHKIAKDRKKIKSLCINYIRKYILSVKIHSLEEEFKEFIICSRLKHFVREMVINDPLFESYVELLNSNIYSILKTPYSFSISNRSHEIKILFKFDLTNIFFSLCKELKLKIDNQYIMSKAMIMMKLGLFDEAFDFIDDHKNEYTEFDFTEYDPSIFFNERRCNIDMMSLSSPLLQPFIYQSFVNPEMVQMVLINEISKLPQEGNLLQLAIYPNIRFIVQRNASIRPYHDRRSMRNDYIENCEKFLKTYLGLPRSISLLTAFGNYADALAQCLVSNGNKGEIMLKYALTAAMSTNHFKQFLLEFHKVDPGERMTSRIWEYLLQYSKKNGLRLLRFELLLSRGDLEEAAHEALEEFQMAKTSTLQLCFIGNAVNCLIEAKHLPQRTTPLSDNFESILVLAELQKDLCIQVINYGLPHCPDLINNPDSVVEALSLLLKHNNPLLYAKIIAMFPAHSNLTTVLESLIHEDVDINKIAHGVKTIYGNTGILSLISVISMTHHFGLIPELIMDVIGIEHKETVANLLIEFDCLTAAAAFVENEPSLQHLVPIIGMRASELGDVHLTKRCNIIIKNGNI